MDRFLLARICAVVFLMPLSFFGAAGNPAAALPGLVYHPEGDAIVVHNGTRWDNRPLYCNARQRFVFAGEMPGLSGGMGTLNAGVVRGNVRLQLDQFSQRTARYRPGRMEWEVTDPKLPGLTVTMTATTIAEGEGFTVQVQVTGAAAGDELVWLYFPSSAEKGTPVAVQVIPDGFRVGGQGLSLSDAPVRTQVVDFKLRGNLDALLSAVKDPLQKGTGAAFIMPLAGTVAQQFALSLAPKPLNARRAFEDGMARVTALGRQVVVDTPDPYFNAGVGASCAAMYGLYVAPYFVHGGVRWRGCYPGWRVMDGVTAYGWHNLVATAMKYHGEKQVSKANGKTAAEADSFGAEQSKQSRFYGLGRLMSSDRYDMQSQFFDQCSRDWRATGDPVFEKQLLPMLELHLQWAKECFDPDADGLYESYINTWPSDSQWYNGGGSVEESAYIYYQRRAAADMCRRANRNEDAAMHNAEADKIRVALDRILWLKEKGQYAAYVEQGGHRRVHDDAWIYSAHLPIEAGMATPEQAWQAMYYTDWAMEKFKLPYGGEMRQTSNWVPSQWSIRELFHGDNFAMALGYFRGGQGDEGWNLLRGTMLESMYGDVTPKAGYGTERTQAPQVNFISPGGLSRPNCSIDFNDVTSMFCRTVVEGLFGYQPDYPNGTVTIAPAFPAVWEHASIKTPDYALAFRRDGDVDRYTVGLTRPAKMSLRLPIRAETVKAAVTVNGAAVRWKIEPWAGCGMMFLELPESGRAEVTITLVGRMPQVSAVVLTKKVGETKIIANASDPQGCLGPKAKSGHHLAFARVQRDSVADLQMYQVPYLQVYQVNVIDPEGEAARAAKQLREAPAAAKWASIPLDGVFNGDVRQIFKQKYLSPRPDTVSCRMGYDGWSAWTFQPWKIRPPDIKFDKVASLLDPERRLATPQRAVFAPVGEPKNIAFTSLWDNWPHSVTVPVNKTGEAVWLLVCGNSNPMQGRIANAVLKFRYADGKEESFELVPPLNFWSLCRFGNVDYSYERDGFALPKNPPPQVQLGANCRAMVYGWKLRSGVELKDVTLETLSQEVVIGLMGVSIMNPANQP